jgi:hypothetical protein
MFKLTEVPAMRLRLFIAAIFISSTAYAQPITVQSLLFPSR